MPSLDPGGVEEEVTFTDAKTDLKKGFLESDFLQKEFKLTLSREQWTIEKASLKTFFK